MRMKVLYKSILILALLFVSCRNYFIEEDDPLNLEENAGQEMNALFEYDSEKREYQFQTSAEQFVGENGYTVWCTPHLREKVQNDSGNNEVNEFEFETTISKESGNMDAGYGVVFCAQEMDSVQFMLCVLINSKGMYIAGKVRDGLFERISDWQNSNSIKKGYGVENKILISYKEEEKSFMLKINDSFVTMISVEEDLFSKSSRYGYAVVISNNEKFPENPVKCVFKQGGAK